MSRQTYQVKPGHRFGVGKALGPGDTVELTAAEAQGFLDKLELVPEAKRGELVVNPTGDPAKTGSETGDTDGTSDGETGDPTGDPKPSETGDGTEKTEDPKTTKGKKA